jgi:hypothetical protein
VVESICKAVIDPKSENKADLMPPKALLQGKVLPVDNVQAIVLFYFIKKG